MLRGDAQAAYFARYLTPEQATFMHGVLSMPARPGSLPPITKRLRRPMADEPVANGHSPTIQSPSGRVMYD